MGIEVPYDTARKVFVLSPKLEDRLLLLIRNDLQKASVVNQGVTYYGKAQTIYSDQSYQRQWRRIVREHFLPRLQNEKRMIAIVKRLKTSKEKAKVKEKVLSAEEIDYSATDSDESDEGRKKQIKKGKSKVIVGMVSVRSLILKMTQAVKGRIKYLIDIS